MIDIRRLITCRIDVAIDLLGHLDHVLKWPPANSTIEAFVKVRAVEAVGPCQPHSGFFRKSESRPF